jgi:hypothetical protein
LTRLREHHHEEVDEPKPNRERIEHEQQQGRVHPVARALGGRLHDFTVLSVIAALQLAWLATIVYSTYDLFF